MQKIILIFLSFMVLSTNIFAYEVTNEMRIDRAISLVVKEHKYDVAKMVLLSVKKQIPDTAYNGKHFFGLSLVYRGLSDYQATYYFATKALQNAKTWHDSVRALAMQGGVFYKIGDYKKALVILNECRDLSLSNDVRFLNNYHIETAITNCKEGISQDDDSSLSQKCQIISQGIMLFIAVRLPIIYPIFNHYNIDWLLKILLAMFISLFFTKRVPQKSLIATAFRYYILFYGFNLIFNVIATYSFIAVGTVDYFTDWQYYYPELSMCANYGLYIVAFLFLDYSDKWSNLKYIGLGIRNISLGKQIKYSFYGLFCLFSCRIVLISTQLLPKINIPLFSSINEFPLLYRSVYLTIVLFLAPIFEEILYRWFIFRSMRSITNIWISITITTTLFLIAHTNSGDSLTYAKAINVTLISIITSLLLEKTDSIIPSIAVHMFNNLIGF